MRWVSTRVLPEPAPATMSSGDPSCRTAARCCGLSPSSRASTRRVRASSRAARSWLAVDREPAGLPDAPDPGTRMVRPAGGAGSSVASDAGTPGSGRSSKRVLISPASLRPGPDTAGPRRPAGPPGPGDWAGAAASGNSRHRPAGPVGPAGARRRPGPRRRRRAGRPARHRQDDAGPPRAGRPRERPHRRGRAAPGRGTRCRPADGRARRRATRAAASGTPCAGRAPPAATPASRSSPPASSSVGCSATPSWPGPTPWCSTSATSATSTPTSRSPSASTSAPPCGRTCSCSRCPPPHGRRRSRPRSAIRPETRHRWSRRTAPCTRSSRCGRRRCRP